MPYAAITEFEVVHSAKSTKIDFSVSPVIDNKPIVLGLLGVGAFLGGSGQHLINKDIKELDGTNNIMHFNSGGERRTAFSKDGADPYNNFSDFPIIFVAAYYQEQGRTEEIITDVLEYANPAYNGDSAGSGDPVIVSPPTGPPLPELYQLHITTPVTPKLPLWAVEWLRTRAFDGGWSVINFYQSDDGYTLDLEKNGSITVILLIAMVITILAETRNRG